LTSTEVPRLRIVQGTPSRPPAAGGDPEWDAHLDHEGRICAYTRAVDGGGWLYLPGLARYRFPAEDGCIEARPEVDATPDMVTDAYYRVALPMALLAAGYEVLHASAVSDGRGLHLFCGASRSGKSTIAYALGRRGFQVWADDAVAFKVGAGGITAVPVPFALRLRAEVADFFEVPTRKRPQASGKTEALRHQGVGPRDIASVSLLERGRDSTISRLSAPESLPAVLYHSFYFSLRDSSILRRMATQYLELVARVPVFRVSLRPGLDAMPNLLDDLERRVFTRAPG